MNPFPCGSRPYHDARTSLHVACPLTDVCAHLHAPSDQSAVFHFVAHLTDMRVPLHAAVFHFIAHLTDMHVPLHASSNWSAVFQFVAPLIGIHAIYIFLLLTYAFSHIHKTLTLPLLLP